MSLVRSIELGVPMAFKKSLKDVPPEEIVRMVESGDQEPVAHQLFREAFELRYSEFLGAHSQSALPQQKLQ